MTSLTAKAYASRRLNPFPFCHLISTTRSLLRPSVRLKTSLYSLSLAIFLLVILALNAAHTPNAPAQTDSILNTAPTHDTLADSVEGKKVAQGKDAHLVDEEIQRSFEEPSFALLSGSQPSQIGCDVPLDGEESEKGVLIFLGIFSGVEKKERRDLSVQSHKLYVLSSHIAGEQVSTREHPRLPIESCDCQIHPWTPTLPRETDQFAGGAEILVLASDRR